MESNVKLTEKRYEAPADEEVAYLGRRRRHIESRVRHKRIISGVTKHAVISTERIVEKGIDAGAGRKKTDTEKEAGNIKRLARHAVNDTRGILRAARLASGKRKKAEDDSEYSGNKPDKGDAEYQGRRKKTKKTLIGAAASLIFVKLAVAIKAIMAAISNIVIVVVIIAVVVITATVAVIQNATYDFVVDEEAHIREIMSNVTYSLSADIEEKRVENECDTVICAGHLTDWKEIIALWWTIKTHVSETEGWNGYFNGDDQRDIEYIFYEFNHVEYSVEEPVGDETKGKKILRMTITNTSLNELKKQWALDSNQLAYLDSILEDEEIWKEILGTSELSRIAFAEIGNSNTWYREWYQDASEDESSIFVCWCLNQAGCISDTYILKSDTAAELKAQMMQKGFIKFKGIYSPCEGDIVFLKMNGITAAGIITRIYEDDLYITMNGYNGHTVVEEIVINKASGMIDSYAHVGSFFVTGMNNGGLTGGVLDIALSYIGVKATGNNNVIFNTDYYGQEVNGDYPWCCTFVWDIFRMSGCSEAFYNGGKTASCPAVSDWAEKENLLIPNTEGQPGDLILFDWNRNGVADHIGFIYNVNADGTYTTIEGNTGFYSQDSGGEVMMRTRPLSTVYQIVRPEY